MTETHAIAAPSGSLLDLVKGLPKKLWTYALEQMRANPSVFVVYAARFLTAAANVLPVKLRGPATRLIAFLAAALLRSAVSPAQEHESAVQKFVTAARERLTA